MAGTLAVLLAGLTVLVGAAPQAEAAVATGGAGRFLEAIDWVVWGSNNQNLPNGGFTGTSSRIVGGQPLVVTCTTSRITSTQPGQTSPFLQAYRPGNWGGDALDEMYNVGGTGASNTLVNALSNWAQGALVEFDFSCSATLSGTPVPLAGLVVADAEQSGGAEYVTADPVGDATWRIIDRYRTPGCTASTVATRSATNELTLAGPATALCTSGPAAVAFMEGSTSARVGLRGGGKSAVALGVVLAADHGDAPANYGDAAHLGSFGFNGGTLAAGVPTRVSDTTFALGTAAPPAIRMGANLDPETAASSSADATGDDASGNGVFGPADDEDGLRSGTSVTGAVGSSYSATVACGPAGGSVAGWIDWNVDGDFLDAGERSGTSTCAGGTATVTWPSIPDSVVGQPVGSSTFMRLRLAQDPADLAGPTSLARSGEVEDHRVTLDLGPTLQVTKNLRSRAYPGDQFAVSISLGPLTVASATTSGTASGVSTRQVIAAPGINYTVSERLAAGPGTLADYQAPQIICSNTVTGVAVPVMGTAPSWTLPTAGRGDRYACTITNEALTPGIALTKSVSEVVDLDGDGPDAGDQVSYSFQVRNTGDAPLSGVEVVEEQFSGTGTAPVASCPGSPVSLAPGAEVVCTATYTLTQADVDAGEVTNTATYTLTQADIDAGEVTNTVTATGTPPPGTELPDPTPSTAVVPTPQDPELTLTKSVSPAQGVEVGDEVTYSFLI
ncbi:CshA/CshB family fibrillar adhesin-related protein, partial [Auraticoccus cholistanensis]|uniref:CshA/CshB family fibrillar adhesin-related protein n=1 Tax=Auraticoccus cholistanensis TaxID=2656650 RepID=UPI0018D2117F